MRVRLSIERINTAIRDTSDKRNTTLGANRTIICGNKIRKFATVGAESVINGDVPDYALMAGVPVRRIGWMSKYGE